MLRLIVVKAPKGEIFTIHSNKLYITGNLRIRHLMNRCQRIPDCTNLVILESLYTKSCWGVDMGDKKKAVHVVQVWFYKEHSKFYVFPVYVVFLWHLKIKELLRNFWYYNLLI